MGTLYLGGGGGGGDFKMGNGKNNNIYYKDGNHVTKMGTFKCI